MTAARRALGIAALLLAACSPWPKDTRGTTDQILEEGVLYAGLSVNPPWTLVADGTAAGVEVELVEALAESLGVDVSWSVMTESQLADALEAGQIHIAIAGFHAGTPSAARFTRSYVSYQGRRHVMAVPHGESRWLVIVESFLHDRGGEVLRAIERLEAPASL